MAVAITSLLSSWHLAFYRFGMFDCASLEVCLLEHMPTLDSVRGRRIEGLKAYDETTIQDLFTALRTALRGRQRRSPRESGCQHGSRSGYGYEEVLFGFSLFAARAGFNEAAV